MKRQLYSIFFASLVLVLAWLYGYDFNHRGIEALLTALGCLVMYLFVNGWSGWEK